MSRGQSAHHLPELHIIVQMMHQMGAVVIIAINLVIGFGFLQSGGHDCAFLLIVDGVDHWVA